MRIPRVISAVLLSAFAVSAAASPALASTPAPAKIVVPAGPTHFLGVSEAATGIKVMCKATPAFKRAMRHHSYADASSVRRLCAKYGRRTPARMAGYLSPPKPKLPKVSAFATYLCVGAGCSFIWEYNVGGGWTETTYEADLYVGWGQFVSGNVNIVQWTKATNHYATWNDWVSNNAGPGWFYGYHYSHPVTTVHSWVEVNLIGTALITSGYVVGIGPIATWQYVT